MVGLYLIASIQGLGACVKCRMQLGRIDRICRYILSQTPKLFLLLFFERICTWVFELCSFLRPAPTRTFLGCVKGFGLEPFGIGAVPPPEEGLVPC